MSVVSDLASAFGHEGTKTNQGSCIVYNTEKPARKHAQSMILGLFVETSLFRLTGWLHIQLFLFI